MLYGLGIEAHHVIPALRIDSSLFHVQYSSSTLFVLPAMRRHN